MPNKKPSELFNRKDCCAPTVVYIVASRPYPEKAVCEMTYLDRADAITLRDSLNESFEEENPDRKGPYNVYSGEMIIYKQPEEE